MAREFTTEATVYVWRFLGPKHPGHAAIKLTGLPNGARTYISWWPEKSAGKSSAHEVKVGTAHHSYKRDMYSEMGQNARTLLELNPRMARSNQRNVLVQFEGEDKPEWEWGTNADEKIKLPGLGADGITFGLDLVRMQEWWTVFRSAPHPVYKYASKNKNCSGVAAAALRMGGADQFATPPSAMIYIDPNQVSRWAKEVKKELERRNKAAADIERDIVAAGENLNLQVVEVMTFREWMTFSNKDMKGAKLRSDKVQEIDKLLKHYHSYNWSAGLAIIKLRALTQLMDVIHYYLSHKAGAKRGDAVLQLGLQVLAVARAKTIQFQDQAKGIMKELDWTERELSI